MSDERLSSAETSKAVPPPKKKSNGAQSSSLPPTWRGASKLHLKIAKALKASAAKPQDHSPIPQIAKRLGVHSSTVYYVQAKLRGKPYVQRRQSATHAQMPEKLKGRVAMSTYVLVRKLKAALRERLMEGQELGDVEVYAHLLIKKLLPKD